MLCAVGKVLKIITREHQEMAFIELWLDEFASKLKTESQFRHAVHDCHSLESKWAKMGSGD